VAVELYQDVALTQDVPTHQLKAGDVATLIDFVPDPDNGEEGCVLEVFNAVGESMVVVVVPISAIKELQSNEILTIRALPSAS
jgi:putative heme iron utilization protein